MKAELIFFPFELCSAASRLTLRNTGAGNQDQERERDLDHVAYGVLSEFSCPQEASGKTLDVRLLRLSWVDLTNERKRSSSSLPDSADN